MLLQSWKTTPPPKKVRFAPLPPTPDATQQDGEVSIPNLPCPIYASFPTPTGEPSKPEPIYEIPRRGSLYDTPDAGNFQYGDSAHSALTAFHSGVSTHSSTSVTDVQAKSSTAGQKVYIPATVKLFGEPPTGASYRAASMNTVQEEPDALMFPDWESDQTNGNSTTGVINYVPWPPEENKQTRPLSFSHESANVYHSSSQPVNIPKSSTDSSLSEYQQSYPGAGSYWDRYGSQAAKQRYGSYTEQSSDRNTRGSGSFHMSDSGLLSSRNVYSDSEILSDPQPSGTIIHKKQFKSLSPMVNPKRYSTDSSIRSSTTSQGIYDTVSFHNKSQAASGMTLTKDRTTRHPTGVTSPKPVMSPRQVMSPPKVMSPRQVMSPPKVMSPPQVMSPRSSQLNPDLALSYNWHAAASEWQAPSMESLSTQSSDVQYVPYQRQQTTQRDSWEMQSKSRDSLEMQSKLRDSLDMQSKLRDSLDMQSKLRGSSDMQSKLRDSLDMQSKFRGSSDMKSKLRDSLDMQSKLRDSLDMQSKLRGSSDMQSNLRGSSDMQSNLRGSSDMQSNLRDSSDMQSKFIQSRTVKPPTSLDVRSPRHSFSSPPESNVKGRNVKSGFSLRSPPPEVFPQVRSPPPEGSRFTSPPLGRHVISPHPDGATHFRSPTPSLSRQVKSPPPPPEVVQDLKEIQAMLAEFKMFDQRLEAMETPQETVISHNLVKDIDTHQISDSVQSSPLIKPKSPDYSHVTLPQSPSYDGWVSKETESLIQGGKTFDQSDSQHKEEFVTNYSSSQAVSKEEATSQQTNWQSEQNITVPKDSVLRVSLYSPDQETKPVPPKRTHKIHKMPHTHIPGVVREGEDLSKAMVPFSLNRSDTQELNTFGKSEGENYCKQDDQFHNAFKSKWTEQSQLSQTSFQGKSTIDSADRTFDKGLHHPNVPLRQHPGQSWRDSSTTETFTPYSSSRGTSLETGRRGMETSGMKDTQENKEGGWQWENLEVKEQSGGWKLNDGKYNIHSAVKKNDEVEELNQLIHYLQGDMIIQDLPSSTPSYTPDESKSTSINQDTSSLETDKDDESFDQSHGYFHDSTDNDPFVACDASGHQLGFTGYQPTEVKYMREEDVVTPTPGSQWKTVTDVTESKASDSHENEIASKPYYTSDLVRDQEHTVTRASALRSGSQPAQHLAGSAFGQQKHFSENETSYSQYNRENEMVPDVTERRLSDYHKSKGASKPHSTSDLLKDQEHTVTQASTLRSGRQPTRSLASSVSEPKMHYSEDKASYSQYKRNYETGVDSTKRRVRDYLKNREASQPYYTSDQLKDQGQIINRASALQSGSQSTQHLASSVSGQQTYFPEDETSHPHYSRDDEATPTPYSQWKSDTNVTETTFPEYHENQLTDRQYHSSHLAGSQENVLMEASASRPAGQMTMHLLQGNLVPSAQTDGIPDISVSDQSGLPSQLEPGISYTHDRTISSQQQSARHSDMTLSQSEPGISYMRDRTRSSQQQSAQYSDMALSHKDTYKWDKSESRTKNTSEYAKALHTRNTSDINQSSNVNKDYYGQQQRTVDSAPQKDYLSKPKDSGDGAGSSSDFSELTKVEEWDPVNMTWITVAHDQKITQESLYKQPEVRNNFNSTPTE